MTLPELLALSALGLILLAVVAYDIRESCREHRERARAIEAGGAEV